MKKSKLLFPTSVYGKYVTGVGRGHEMIDTSKIPIITAPRTRYIINNAVKIPQQKMPIHVVGLRILSALGHNPVVASRCASEQPANSMG